MSRTHLSFALAACLGAGPLLHAQRNPDFEADAAGAKVTGWLLPVNGYRATAAARDGGVCAHLQKADARGPGNLMQMVDARPFRGRYVRLRAEVRVQPRTTARLWMRVDRPGGRGFFDSMGANPIRSSRWKRYEIVGKVADDATRIALGVMLIGDSAWVDNVELAAIEVPADAAPQPPRALDGRALRNVRALARLVGLVRYFHPSTEGQALDWPAFTIHAVRAVEAAKDDAELAGRLKALFAAVAPAVQVATNKGPFPVPAALRRPEDPKGVEVVAWEHHGMGQDRGGIYRSKVVAAPLTGGALGALFGMKKPGDLPDPAAQLEIDLVGGLRCALPLALYQAGGKTLPRPEGAPPDLGSPLPPTAEDRATRLGAVILAWNVFQHFYPYFDVVEVDWDAALTAALRRAAEDATAGDFLHTLQEMVALLRDGHGYVGHTADPDTATLPLTFTWAGDQLVVEHAEGAPGIERGDVVTHFGDETVAARAARLGRRVSASTPQFLRHRLLTELRRGRPGTDVVLRVRRGDEALAQRVALSPGFGQLRDREPQPLTRLEPGIWYIDVDRVTSAQFQKALSDLVGAKGIVIDFRGYPQGLDPQTFFGHIISEPVQSAQWHIPIPRRPDRVGMECEASQRWLIQPRKPHIGGKLVFITDGRAISYAESCMGIVEHYRLGAIVGEATAGTNGNVNPITLPGGYSISWTGMKVLKHDGSRHHGVGILPTVPVQRTVEGIAAGRDELLERAVAVAKGS